MNLPLPDESSLLCYLWKAGVWGYLLICSLKTSRYVQQASKAFSPEPSKGHIPTLQSRWKSRGIMTSITCSHFWDIRSHFHFFPHVTAVELFVTVQVCIPGIQSKNVLLCYNTTLEGTKPPLIPIKLHQSHTSRGILQNHGKYSGIPQTGI